MQQAVQMTPLPHTVQIWKLKSTFKLVSWVSFLTLNYKIRAVYHMITPSIYGWEIGKACFFLLLLLLLFLFLFSFVSFYYKVNVDLFLKTRDYNIRVLWRREMSAFFLMLFFAYKYRVEILSLLHAWHFLAYLSLYAGVLKSQWNLQGKITCRIIQKI